MGSQSTDGSTKPTATAAANSPTTATSQPSSARSPAPGAGRGRDVDRRRAPAVVVDRQEPPAVGGVPGGDPSSTAHRLLAYSLSRPRLMIVFWISLVPSPMSRNGASRMSRSISYSLE